MYGNGTIQKASFYPKKTYSENKRTGVWDFNKNDGTPEWQYDFDRDSFLIKPTEIPTYSYLSSDGEWIKGKADKDVVWLRSKAEWSFFSTRNLRYPIDAINKGEQGKIVVEISVDENGNSTEFSVPEKVSHSLGEEAIRIVKFFQPEFLPAEKDGKKVKTKVQCAIEFRLG